MHKHSSILKRRRYYGREFMPGTRRKVFLPNPDKKKTELFETVPHAPTYQRKLGPRVNKLDIQMLSSAIYSQVFNEQKVEKVNAEVIKYCKKELEKHKMVTNPDDYAEDVDFKIPPLLGKDVEEHFHIIGE